MSEEIIVTSETGGQKGKKDVQLHAIPWDALEQLGRVYAFGADKYEDYNFRKGYDWSLTFDAMQRHLWAFWNGEDLDVESGHYHLAHAIWHGFTLLHYLISQKGTDDRPSTSRPGQDIHEERRDYLLEDIRKAYEGFAETSSSPHLPHMGGEEVS